MKPINLNDFIPGAKHFKWKEALWLPKWNIFTFPSEEQWGNIILTASKMETVRDILKTELTVSSWLRPMMYNNLINGAKCSYHLLGLACDFTAHGMDVLTAKKLLEPHLAKNKIRMEQDTTTWIHIDLGHPGGSGYYFKA